MTQQRRAFIRMAAAATGCAVPFGATAQTVPGLFDADHVPWVAQVLTRMLTIKPGMTRGDLLRVFTTEGGLSTPWQQTFVSPDCPYFKVDVEFQRSNADIILKISRPYLAFAIAD